MSDTGETGDHGDDVTATDPPPAIRVLVVDHRVVTETLAAVIDLQGDLQCVGMAGTPRSKPSGS